MTGEWAGDRLAGLLHRFGFSQRHMAALLGVSHNRMRGVLTGREEPPPEVAGFWSAMERLPDPPDCTGLFWPMNQPRVISRHVSDDLRRTDPHGED